MQIEIRLFGNLKDMVPESRPSISLEMINRPVCVGQIIKELQLPDDISLITTVNGKHATNDQFLQEGDVLSIFPPIAGG